MQVNVVVVVVVVAVVAIAAVELRRLFASLADIQHC